MKTWMMMALSILLVQLASAQTNGAANSQTNAPLVAKLDTEYGFRGLKFEQAIADCPGMVLLEGDNELKYYKRPDDRLEFGGVKLTTIEYEFYKGKLSNVNINSANGAQLLAAFEKEYGPGHRLPAKPGKAYWTARKVTADYLPLSDGKGSVGLWCKTLQALRRTP